MLEGSSEENGTSVIITHLRVGSPLYARATSSKPGVPTIQSEGYVSKKAELIRGR